METQNTLAFLAISMVAMCFGWGMRGSAIGGEKGAMLPGAFMGILRSDYPYYFSFHHSLPQKQKYLS